MDFKVTHNHFSTEDEAIAEIKSAGFYPLTIEVPAEKNDPHWHDFDAMTFVLEGTLVVKIEETGEIIRLGPGATSFAEKGIVHSENHDGFKAVFGFSADPASFTQPINKPLV